MEIRNTTDWWKVVNETVPQIKAYVSLLIGDVDSKIDDKIDEVNQYIKDNNHEKTHDWFESLWAALPDRQEIHFGPFNDICDICSEHWVFDEDSSIWGIDSQLQ